jgi:hypothetical protein
MDAAGAPAFKAAPLRRITATALPPGTTLLIVSWSGLVRTIAFLGTSVTVSFAGSNVADRSFVTGEFLAANNPFPLAVATWKFATLLPWAASTGPLKLTTISVTRCFLFVTSWTLITVTGGVLGGVGVGVGAATGPDGGVGVGVGAGAGVGVGVGVGVAVGAGVTTN